MIHVVAFIDILGSSQILLSEDDNAINNYLAGIDGLNFWARNEENGTVDSWDRVRDKDLWALSYYNEFCKKNDLPEMVIDFKEEYIPSFGKIVIKIENEEGSDN